VAKEETDRLAAMDLMEYHRLLILERGVGVVVLEMGLVTVEMVAMEVRAI
jgi:hypothetical protein